MTASRFESGDESEAKPVEKTIIVVPRAEKVKTTASRFESGDESDVKPTKSTKFIRRSAAGKVSESDLPGRSSDKKTSDKAVGAEAKGISVDPTLPNPELLPSSDAKLSFKEWKQRNIVKEAAANIENAKLASESDSTAPGTIASAKSKRTKQNGAKMAFSVHDEDWPDLDSESVTSHSQ